MNICASPLCDGQTAAAVDTFLCWGHRNRLQLDARDAAELYDELADRLAHGPGRDYEPRVQVSKNPGIDLDDRKVAARDLIAHVLANWVEILRGAGAPAPYPTRANVRGAAQFIGRNSSRLAAHVHAADASEELHELAHGAPYAAAYPNGETSVRTVDGEACRTDGCTGSIRAIMRRQASLLASVLVCDLDPSHRWAPHEWLELVDQADELVDASVVAAALGYSDPGPVHQLARRGRLVRHDTADGPRYSLADVRALIREWQAAA